MTKIRGYEGLYDITEDGIVTNLKTGNILDGSVNSYGYRVVSLHKNGKRKICKVHRLLATTFIPNPNNYSDVNHIDGNKLNNSLDNLEWCSRSMNNAHARDILNLDYSIKPVVQSTMDGKVIAIWASATAAATFVNGNSTLIQACCAGSATSAYGYQWEYANIDYAKMLKDFQASKIEREIDRLSRALSTLRKA